MLSHLRSHPRLRDDRSHRPCNARICRTTHIDRRKHHRHACTWWYERPQRRICPPLYPSKRDIKHRCSRTPQRLDEFGIRGDRPRGPHHDRGLLRHLVTGLHHPGDRLPTGTQGYPRHAQLHRRQQPPVRSNGLSSRHRGSRSIVVYGIQPAMVVQASLHRTAWHTRVFPRERVRNPPEEARKDRTTRVTDANMSVPRTDRCGAHSCTCAYYSTSRRARSAST